jgi:hypothetical protein
MKTYAETKCGEIVEVINGTLVCNNTKENWMTICDWLMAQDDTFTGYIIVNGRRLMVDFPKTYPTHVMGSLLEHFEHF